MANFQLCFYLGEKLKMSRGYNYTVVFTIKTPKSKSLTIHAVPTHWIRDGILHYPPKEMGSKIDGLIKLGNLMAIDPKWKMYACIVRKKFKTLEQANKFVAATEKLEDTDTDADDILLKDLQRKQNAINKGKLHIEPVASTSSATVDHDVEFGGDESDGDDEEVPAQDDDIEQLDEVPAFELKKYFEGLQAHIDLKLDTFFVSIEGKIKECVKAEFATTAAAMT